MTLTLLGTQAKQYTSTLDCFQKIFTTEGPAGFYKGVIPRMGRVVPGQVSNSEDYFLGSESWQHRIVMSIYHHVTAKITFLFLHILQLIDLTYVQSIELTFFSLLL